MTITESSASNSDSRRTFHALDGWRGVCAILVALFHLSAAGHLYDFPLVRGGSAGVEFFFVLSGFVIAHAYAGRLDGFVDGVRFIIRRFGRLYPLHLATLMALVFLEVVKLLAMNAGASAGVAPFEGANSIGALIGNLFLLQGLGIWNEFTWNGPSWSISTEFWTYFLFLLVFLCCATWKRALLASVAIVGLCGVLLVILPLLHIQLSPTGGRGLIKCIYGFLIGVITYSIYLRYANHRSRAIAFFEFVCGGAILAVVCYEFPLRAILMPIVFGICVGVFAYERGPISNLLKGRSLQFLGQHSYSIYMIHGVVLAVLNGALRVVDGAFGIQLYQSNSDGAVIDIGPIWLMDALWIGYIGVILVLSWISFRYIEDPARRCFNALSNSVAITKPPTRVAGASHDAA